ncbi:MAG: transposase [Paracoccaceae bacterium]
MDNSGAEILGKKRIRRTWSDDEKRMICDQARLRGVSTVQVSRRYAMNANLHFKWLRDPAYQADIAVCNPDVFLPVEISDDPPRELPVPVMPTVAPPHLEPEDQSRSVSAGRIEITRFCRKVFTWLKKGLSLTQLCCEGRKLLER